MGSDTLLVTVNNVAPTVSAWATPTLALPRQEVAFGGTFTDPGWLDTHVIAWDLGDGTVAEGSLTTSHAYDPVGNRLSLVTSSGSTSYEYDAANRLTSVDGVGYTWDARGNLIGDGAFTYAYNAAGRMVRAESITATLVYTYNANGLRVVQSVDGDVTTFAWDWASALPEMLSEGSNLYLVGHDTLGQWDGATWAYHLPDALGSVRQLVDGAGMVTSAREWTPYGVEVGTAQVGLGYTGEWWDADAALLYLRARWYEPGGGRFTRSDVWPGDTMRPLSLNRWNYAEANPVRFVDRTGLFPSRDQIEDEDAEFTCKCGWIDWNHVAKSDELSFALVDDLVYAGGNFRMDPTLSNNWGFYIGIPLGWGGLEFDLFSAIAVVPNRSLLDGCITSLAVSIFMDANEQFEERQGALGWLPRGLGARLRASYYSEEDLSSDIIGFYIGYQRFSIGLKSEQIKSQIRERCGAVGRQASLDVFEETYENGDRAVTNWRNWYARVLPLTGCKTAGLCSGSRTWPSEFAALTSARVPAVVDGTWWWYRGWPDGFPVWTERPRVYRFSADRSVPTPPIPSGTPYP